MFAQQVDTVVEKYDLVYTVQFEFNEIPESKSEASSGYRISGAKIYDSTTGNLIQEIDIPSKLILQDKENKYNVKYIDFYKRKIAEAKDFSVLMDSWYDPIHFCARTKRNFYLFDSTKKSYYLDTTLSNHNDVFFDEQLKSLRRYVFKTSAKSRITYTYQLENKKWLLIDTNEALFEPIPPKIKYPSSNFISVDKKSHQLPLKAVIGNDTKLQVKDTFWLYKTCDDTLYITQVQSASKAFFSINPTLLPKQKTPLIFNGILREDSYDFTTNYFHCALTLTDRSILSFDVNIPTISNNSIVYYRPDSSVNYAIGNQPNARFSTVVFTYPSGQISIKGTILDKDTNRRVGHWVHYKEGTIESELVGYSKSISLTALDDTYGLEHNHFKVKVFENGSWKEPIMDAANNEISLFINPKTEKIVAYTDSTQFDIDLKYKQLSIYTDIAFYLLKPNERTLKIDRYEIPFEVVKNQYTIILNDRILKSSNENKYELTNGYITALQKQYPEISTFWIDEIQRCFSLQNLDDKTRRKVLKQLVRDSSISFVSQLFYTNRNLQRINYCDNKVIAAIDIDADYPVKFWLKARIRGFSSIETDEGYNRFWLTYPSKLIDDDFFNAFKKLTRQKLVFFANFNSYIAPEKTKN